MSLNPPIFVALDVDNDQQALSLAERVGPYVGGFKVGPRLCMRYGAGLVKSLSAHASVFVDNKYFDIPSTMESAVRASFASGASFTTIHAQSGPEALRRLAQVEAELNQERPFHLLAVTILTSFTQETLPPNSQAQPIDQQVRDLAQMTLDSGVKGLVCSAHEVEALRKAHPEACLVTPGIRLPENEAGDQKRVMGPKEAMALGASALVVGRPICQADDPIKAAQRFQQELAKTAGSGE